MGGKYENIIPPCTLHTRVFCEVAHKENFKVKVNDISNITKKMYSIVLFFSSYFSGKRIQFSCHDATLHIQEIHNVLSK